MEKKFSMDEVNNFLANFKKKRGKKTVEKPKIENEIKNENKIESNKPDDIFGGGATTTSIFDNDNDNNKNNIENIFDKKDDKQNDNLDIFDKKDDEQNKNLDILDKKEDENNNFEKFERNEENNNPDIFGKTEEKNNVDIFWKNEEENNDDIFGKNEEEKKRLDVFDKNEIKEDDNRFNHLNEKFNDFNSGMVLNNPLLNEDEKKDDIFEDKNNTNDIFNDNNNIFNNQNNQTNYSESKNNNIFENQNNQNNIFESNNNDNDPQNIFGSDENNDNNNNIFSQPPNVITENKNQFQNINKKPPFINNKINTNIRKVQPKPPKLNNKFNSPFINQSKPIKKEDLPKNDINDIYNKDINNNYNYNNNAFEDNQNNINENNNFQKNINNEIEKLDDEQTPPPFTDSANNINDNVFNNFELPKINNINSINNKNTNQIINNKKENINKFNFIPEKINKNESNLNCDESYSFSGIDQDYVLLSDNGGANIYINNVYSLLNSYSENQLYEYYFPISYNKEKDLNKLSSLLSIILNNGNELNEPLSHIVIYLFKYILENEINIKKINFLNNKELQNKIIEVLSNSIRNENKGIITLDNLFNTDILFNNLNNSNSSVSNYNIINDNLVHPLDYIINLFNEKILNKNSILYIYLLLLNMKENDINMNNNNIGFEEYDYIFENFEAALFIILKYFNNDIQKICSLLLNSYSPKLKFCHFVILKIMLNDYDIKNEKYYSKKFVSFLQFPNIEKLLIADLYNFIIFTMNTEIKKIIAKSSILIKYKYTLLKQNYKKDQDLVLFGQKIYANITQFGSISKNNHFNNYLKNIFYININISQKSNQNIQDNKSNKNNININNENKKEVKNDMNIPNPNTGNQGGLFTSLKYAFGFGGSDSNNDNKKENEQRVLTEEEKKRLSPEELWRLENPDKPEVEYDPVLKRYRLRGQIYDDQEEVVQKKRIESPMVPPPKSTKYMNKINNKNNDNNDNEEGNINKNVSLNQNKNNIPPSANNRINNPFNSSQFKNQNKPTNSNQRAKMNLINRYAVGYNKK